MVSAQCKSFALSASSSNGLEFSSTGPCNRSSRENKRRRAASDARWVKLMDTKTSPHLPAAEITSIAAMNRHGRLVVPLGLAARDGERAGDGEHCAGDGERDARFVASDVRSITLGEQPFFFRFVLGPAGGQRNVSLGVIERRPMSCCSRGARKPEAEEHGVRTAIASRAQRK